MSALQRFWRNYKVLIVMGPSLGLIHWIWYTIKSNPLVNPNRGEYIPEPDIVSLVTPLPPGLPVLPDWLIKKKKKEEAKAEEAKTKEAKTEEAKTKE